MTMAGWRLRKKMLALLQELPSRFFDRELQRAKVCWSGLLRSCNGVVDAQHHFFNVSSIAGCQRMKFTTRA